MAAVRLMMPNAVTSGQGGGHLGGATGIHAARHHHQQEESSSSAPRDTDLAALSGSRSSLLKHKLEGAEAPISMRGLPPSGGGGLQPAGNALKRQRCVGGAAASSAGAYGGGSDEDVSPMEYLQRILRERGYETDLMPATSEPFFHPPHGKQIEDYDMTLVGAVKRGDLDIVRQLATTGRRMDACNKHGESIVHISCRRGHVEILRFLLDNGARVDICDDLGRTPLHDACWAKDPVFDCVTAILEKDLRMLRIADCRGASPLAYIKKDHWPAWRQFFDKKKEQYWAHRSVGASGASSDGNKVVSVGGSQHAACQVDVAESSSSA